jgi:hypothetical protein
VVRYLATIVVAFVPLASFSQAISAEALARVPVRLSLDRSIWQRPLGSPVALEISLRNALEEKVTAAKDVHAEVRSTLFAAPLEVVISRGRTSATLVFQASPVGVARIVVGAPGLAPASSVLLVSATDPGRAPARLELRPTHSATPAEPMSATRPDERTTSGPGSSARSDAPVNPVQRTYSPKLLVNPEDPRPDLDGTFRVELRVALFDEHGHLVEAADDLPMKFTSRLGRLSDGSVRFKAGDLLSGPVALTATVPGVDELRVFTPLGAATAEVRYEHPVPARIRVEAPSRVESVVGSAHASIAVLLVSQSGVVTSFRDQDIVVTLGTLSATTLHVPHGSPGSEVALDCARDGRARLVASAAGLAPAEASIQFSFPLWLALLAAASAVGATALASRRASPRARAVRSLAIGLTVGLLAYGVASLRAPGDASTLRWPAALSRLASADEIGAVLLGFVSGLVGRALWRVPTVRPEER